jgi:hypothetical protein
VIQTIAGGERPSAIYTCLDHGRFDYECLVSSPFLIQSHSTCTTFHDMATTQYSHEPLDESKKEIRLLFLDPYDEDRETEIANEPLKCSIQRRSLSSAPGIPAPRYHAVSYSWGNKDGGTVPICVDGMPLEVPKRAENVIRSLYRCSGGITGPSAVWIDAICIDQDDLQEKGRQVAMMDLIFRRAAVVQVWLGPSDDSTAVAISSIRAIVEERLRRGDVEWLANFATKMGTHVLKEYIGRPLPNECEWSALLRVFSSEWFTRLWVVQEVVLAQKAICHYGSFNTSFEHVILTAYWVESTRRGLQHISAEEDAGRRGMYNAAQIYSLGRGLPPRRLVDLLKLCPRFQTTDLRDKVFSLLGMSDVWTASRQDRMLDPDYTESIETIYKNGTRAALKEDNSLRLLQDAQALVRSEETPETKEVLQLPSWVPRFHFVRDPDQGALVNIPCQNACNGERLRMRPSEDDVLSLEGMVCDEVAGVTRVMDVSLFANQRALRNHIGRLWVIAQASVSNAAHDLSTAFKAVLLGGSNPEKRSKTGNAALPSTRIDTGEPLESDRQTPHMDTLFADSEIDKQDKWRLKDHQGLAYERWKSYLDELMNMSVNRVFFITEQGRMGLGPANTQKGDKVCILCGGQVPFLLREEGMLWKLVGDAYLDGVMNVSFVPGT